MGLWDGLHMCGRGQVNLSVSESTLASYHDGVRCNGEPRWAQAPDNYPFQRRMNILMLRNVAINT